MAWYVRTGTSDPIGPLSTDLATSSAHLVGVEVGAEGEVEHRRGVQEAWSEVEDAALLAQGHGERGGAGAVEVEQLGGAERSA
jgi:hypothetical protein